MSKCNLCMKRMMLIQPIPVTLRLVIRFPETLVKMLQEDSSSLILSSFSPNCRKYN